VQHREGWLISDVWKAAMDLDDRRSSDQRPKTRRAWQRRFVRHALQHLDLQLQLPSSVIRVGRARQEEEDERKEEDHEDDLEESAPRGCGQGPEKPDEEKYDWPKQDGEDCGDDPLLCWIVHHVDDGIVHRNSFRCGWSLKLSAPS
jgi:hypothetical protein